jgi:hypothetical protein
MVGVLDFIDDDAGVSVFIYIGSIWVTSLYRIIMEGNLSSASMFPWISSEN